MPTPIADGRPIRWGILGAGGIADKVSSDINLTDGSVVTAVAARDADRAARFAARHGAARSYGDYQALVNDDEIDVVYIATTHPYHRAHALLAIDAGKASAHRKARLSECRRRPRGVRCGHRGRYVRDAAPNEAAVLGTQGCCISFLPQAHRPSGLIVHNEAGEYRIDDPLAGQGYGYGPEIDEVARCLRGGLAQSPLIPHADTIAILEILDDSRAALGVVYPSER